MTRQRRAISSSRFFMLSFLPPRCIVHPSILLNRTTWHNMKREKRDSTSTAWNSPIRLERSIKMRFESFSMMPERIDALVLKSVSTISLDGGRGGDKRAMTSSSRLNLICRRWWGYGGWWCKWINDGLFVSTKLYLFNFVDSLMQSEIVHSVNGMVSLVVFPVFDVDVIMWKRGEKHGENGIFMIYIWRVRFAIALKNLGHFVCFNIIKCSNTLHNKHIEQSHTGPPARTKHIAHRKSERTERTWKIDQLNSPLSNLKSSTMDYTRARECIWMTIDTLQFANSALLHITTTPSNAHRWRAYRQERQPTTIFFRSA